MKKSYIKIKTSFEGFHRYPDAESIDHRIAFLSQVHRHMFHVTVTIEVHEHNREIEFFLALWALNDFIKTQDLNNKSCEMIANDIIDYHLKPSYGAARMYTVEVSEDNENSGIVEYTPHVTF